MKPFSISSISRSQGIRYSSQGNPLIVSEAPVFLTFNSDLITHNRGSPFPLFGILSFLTLRSDFPYRSDFKIQRPMDIFIHAGNGNIFAPSASPFQICSLFSLLSFFSNFKQFIPEALKTREEGISPALNPKARHPLGKVGSQVI